MSLKKAALFRKEAVNRYTECCSGDSVEVEKHLWLHSGSFSTVYPEKGPEDLQVRVETYAEFYSDGVRFSFLFDNDVSTANFTFTDRIPYPKR